MPEAAGPASSPDIPTNSDATITGAADEAPQGPPERLEQSAADQEASQAASEAVQRSRAEELAVQPVAEAVQRSRAEDLAVQLRVVEGMEVGSGRIKLSLLAFDSLVSSSLAHCQGPLNR